MPFVERYAIIASQFNGRLLWDRATGNLFPSPDDASDSALMAQLNVDCNAVKRWGFLAQVLQHGQQLGQTIVQENYA